MRSASTSRRSGSSRYHAECSSSARHRGLRTGPGSYAVRGQPVETGRSRGARGEEPAVRPGGMLLRSRRCTVRVHSAEAMCARGALGWVCCSAPVTCRGCSARCALLPRPAEAGRRRVARCARQSFDAGDALRPPRVARIAPAACRGRSPSRSKKRSTFARCRGSARGLGSAPSTSASCRSRSRRPPESRSALARCRWRVASALRGVPGSDSHRGGGLRAAQCARLSHEASVPTGRWTRHAQLEHPAEAGRPGRALCTQLPIGAGDSGTRPSECRLPLTRRNGVAGALQTLSLVRDAPWRLAPSASAACPNPRPAEAGCRYFYALHGNLHYAGCVPLPLRTECQDREPAEARFYHLTVGAETVTFPPKRGAVALHRGTACSQRTEIRRVDAAPGALRVHDLRTGRSSDALWRFTLTTGRCRPRMPSAGGIALHKPAEADPGAWCRRRAATRTC